MQVIYLAHQYGGNPANLDRARRWFAWAWSRRAPDEFFIAPWIDACTHLTDFASGSQPKIATCSLKDLVAIKCALDNGFGASIISDGADNHQEAKQGCERRRSDGGE